ncbi:MAG: hypothetical protein K8T25_23265 [Planctomycetia bacterium]|nr:hypothetical protein [Planctomycetia bacterium]
MKHLLRCTAAVASMILLPAAVALGADITKGQPLAAKWEYSVDGGKTFGPMPPTIPATRTPDEKNKIVARTTFVIEDPAKIGLLKLMTEGNDGALALTDAESIDRYNVGSKPNLTKTQLVLNGAATDAGHAPYTLYRYLGIDPKLLKKGENTLQVSGTFWFQLTSPLPGGLRLETLPVDVVELDRPPVLGAIGEDFFTVAARSVIPATFTVTATPLEPAGPEQKTSFERAKQLKARVAIPKGTHKFRYSITTSAGGASKTVGPFDVTMPTFGEGFRFAVAGGSGAYKPQTEPMLKSLAQLKKAQPQLLIHTGNYQNCPAWDWSWNEVFYRDMGEMLATTPLMPMTGCTEMMSPAAFSQQFYFPPDDKDFGRWTQVIGPVRFVAIEAFSMSEEKSGEALKWLEETLKNAKEPYVIVLNCHTTHGSGRNASRMYRGGIAYTTKNIDPLLVKYKATATIGGYHPSYERIEPPASEGVPTIVACRTASMGRPLHAGYAAENKFSKGSYGGDHVVLFEVKKDKLAMQALDSDGKVIDSCEFAPRK